MSDTNLIQVEAQKRLMRDLKEWYRNKHELITISAEPIESNIFEWHVNISPVDGPYKDCILHLIIIFPDEYPSKPPKVSILNGQYLNHPNVFDNGKWICLDMIKEEYMGDKYYGWTAGYSVTSLLLQLQSFLFAENIPQHIGTAKHSGDIDKSKLLGDCEYENCQHKKDKPWPPLNENRYNEIISDNLNVYPALFHEKSLWSKLFIDLEKYIFKFLSIANLVTMTKICKRFKFIVLKTNIIQKSKYQCWYKKQYLNLHNKNNNENINTNEYDLNLILGYGVKLKFPISYNRYLGNERWNNRYNNKTTDYKTITRIHTTYDLLSYDAFEKNNITKSLYKELEFNYFIPIYINKRHGNKALELFEKLVLEIYKAQDMYNGNNARYNPMMGVDLLLNIMLSLILNVMSAVSNNEQPTLHYSIKLIEAFFNYYHLLLATYIKHESVLKPKIDTIIESFIYDESFRNKKNIPNTGLFRILLSLNDKYQWNDVLSPILELTVTRYIFLTYKKNPRLFRKYDFTKTRNNLFNENVAIKRNRAFMFSYFFLTKCCNMNSSNLNIRKKFDIYNDNYGCPPLDLPNEFQKYCKAIIKCKNYKEFFEIIDLNMKTSIKELDKIIENIMYNYRYEQRWDVYFDLAGSSGSRKRSNSRTRNRSMNSKLSPRRVNTRQKSFKLTKVYTSNRRYSNNRYNTRQTRYTSNYNRNRNTRNRRYNYDNRNRRYNNYSSYNNNTRYRRYNNRYNSYNYNRNYYDNNYYSYNYNRRYNSNRRFVGYRENSNRYFYNRNNNYYNYNRRYNGYKTNNRNNRYNNYNSYRRYNSYNNRRYNNYRRNRTYNRNNRYNNSRPPRDSYYYDGYYY